MLYIGESARWGVAVWRRMCGGSGIWTGPQEVERVLLDQKSVAMPKCEVGHGRIGGQHRQTPSVSRSDIHVHRESSAVLTAAATELCSFVLIMLGGLLLRGDRVKSHRRSSEKCSRDLRLWHWPEISSNDC